MNQKTTQPIHTFEPERITEAQRVWTTVYGRPVTEQEAIEILLAVRRLAKVLTDRARQ